MLGIRFGGVAHLLVQLDARLQCEQAITGNTCLPQLCRFGLTLIGERDEHPVVFQVVRKLRRRFVRFFRFENHAVEKDHIPRLVGVGCFFKVVHAEFDMDAFLVPVAVTHEVRPHGKRVAFHDEQVFAVVELLIQGADVPNLVLGDDVLLTRTEHSPENHQTESHVGHRRPPLLPFPTRHAQDVIGIGEHREKSCEQQCDPRQFPPLKGISPNQCARANRTECRRVEEVLRNGFHVGGFVLQPLSQPHHGHDEHGEWNLHEVVGLVQIGARRQVVLAQVEQHLAVPRLAPLCEKGAEWLQKLVENGQAGLPGDVGRAYEKQQRTNKHPKFSAPNGLLVLGAFKV